MAKLRSYYGLCPLIDHKSLLGICEDDTPGCVIVTLGKNMAIKYKLSDQKQILSWSTKDKLSSPVIYNKKEGKYVAVFNQLFIRFWKETENNLEKIKKIKFPLPLHTILQTEDDPLVIFKNGKVMTLSHALKMRKELPQADLFHKSTTIEDQTCLKVDNKYYVGLLLKSENVYTFIWTTPENQTGDDTSENMRKIELNRSGHKLNGHVVMLTETGPVLFTLWSDGRLHSHLLYKDEPESFYAVIESLSRQQPVCLLALNSTYLAMYGADTNQEGASLQIYNIQFKVTQSKLGLKLFTLGSKLWLTEGNLLVTIGQNLAVVPFHLDTEQLAALVGSHKMTSITDDDDIAIVADMIEENWENTENKNDTKDSSFLDASMKSQFSSLVKEGWSEAAICEEIFPKLLEKQDTRSILNSLDYFSDIPETMLVTLLSYAVQQCSKLVKNTDIINKGITGQYRLLLDRLLAISYSEVIFLPKLRAGLKFDEVLILLQYICFLLSTNGHDLPKLEITQSERKIIEWGCILLDAHYQQFLLSKDSKIVECFKYFMALIDSYLLCIDDLKKIEPILIQVNNGKNSTKLITTQSLKYSIENLKLY